MRGISKCLQFDAESDSRRCICGSRAGWLDRDFISDLCQLLPLLCYLITLIRAHLRILYFALCKCTRYYYYYYCDASPFCFTVFLTVYHQQLAELRQSRKRAKDKIWVTSGIKQSSKHKNKLYRKWLQSKCYFDEERYKNYRKLHKRVVNVAKKQYFKELFDSVLIL